LQKLRQAAIWPNPTCAHAKIPIRESLAFPKGQASGDWNAWNGFDHNWVTGILRQAGLGDDDPFVGDVGVDLCSHYREPEAFQVSQGRPG
jgi:hypothetical protein